jgi:hypothetical protein
MLPEEKLKLGDVNSILYLRWETVVLAFDDIFECRHSGLLWVI